MSDVIITKEAAEKIRSCLKSLKESEKQAQDKLAQVSTTDKEASEKVAEACKAAAAKQADFMLSVGFITKEGYDRTVENLSDARTAMPYLKKAMEMALAAKSTKTASEAEPTPVGKGAGKYPTVKTSKDRLAEADRTFEQAIGL